MYPKAERGVRKMKVKILSLLGCVGSVIASLFGGWDAALATLVIFMSIDYVTGLIVAGVFHTSEKTKLPELPGLNYQPKSTLVGTHDSSHICS